jgi:2-polyprenyl-3-methyl-5-hydroxy-6-metoxy-1,4-benzoquinol methylase
MSRRYLQNLSDRIGLLLDSDSQNVERSATQQPRTLSAKLEPFDSYWQAPADVERGYKSFRQYYKHNFLPHVPTDKQTRILVVSCGPGYLVNLLKEQAYTNVLGIDSDPKKAEYALERNLNCEVANAFPFLQENPEPFDTIICEQELNHLTMDEMLEFLALWCAYRVWIKRSESNSRCGKPCSQY